MVDLQGFQNAEKASLGENEALGVSLATIADVSSQLLFSEYHVYAKQYVLRACSDMLRRAKTLRDVDMKLFLAARDWQEHVRVGSLRSYRYGSILSNVYLRALAVEVAHSYISKHYPHHVSDSKSPTSRARLT